MESPFAPPANHPWQRVSPRLARMRRAVLVGVGVPVGGAIAFGCGAASSNAGVVVGVVALVLLVAAWISIGRNQRSWGYAERSDDLLVTHGALFRKLTVVPYGRMQLVDVEAGPIERSFGLVNVKLHTAAATTDAKVSGLTPDTASRLATVSPGWARPMPVASDRAVVPEYGDRTPGEEVFRLHPLTPIALGGKVLGLMAVFIFFSLLSQRTGDGQGINWVPLAVFGGVSVVVVVRGLVNVAVTRYHLLGGELRIDYGLLQKQSKRVRLNRVQSVDVLEPLAARIFGLAELKVTTAGTERAAVRLRYLARPVAQTLRADLLARSAGAEAGFTEAPERPVLSVPHGRLVRAVLLEMVSWRLVFLLIGPVLGLLGQANSHQTTVGLGVALFFSFSIVIVHAIWRRVSTLWDFTITDSPDGLRIRHGLLSTSRQTVPPGRIQAILIHQPASWRLLGWAQVRMNVAGYAGSANSKSTMLVPVTDLAYALALVGWVFGGIDIDAVPMSRPPRRAALRTPLWWRAQWAGSDERVFVVRHGLLSRTVDVVPHERTQSVCLSAGPLQSALGLATMHLDSTRGPVRTRAKNRDAGQARRMLDDEVELGRSARRSLAPTSPVPSPDDAAARPV